MKIPSGRRQGLALPAIIAACLLAACGSSDSTSSTTAAATGTASTSAGTTRTSYPVTIENCGKKLTFEKAPTRALGDQEQDTVPLIELGLQDRIVAIFSHKASDNIFMGVDPAIDKTIKAYDELSPEGTAYPVFEKVLAAKPDFILQGYPDDAIGGDPKNQPLLDQSGIPVYTESATCPDASPTMESTFEDLRNLGIIFDVQDRAAEVIAEQKASIAETEAAVKDLDKPRAFLIDSFGEGGEIYTNTSSFVRDEIEAAGGTPVPDPGPDPYTTSREALAASNFDIVLVAHYADPSITKSVGTDQERAEQVFKAAPGAPGSKAHRWAAVPYPSGPSTALILRRFAEALHPEAFGK